MPTRQPRSLKASAPNLILIPLFTLLLGSCTSLMTGLVVKPAVGNLQRQQDVELVCDGAAAYLLMIDSLLESSPNNRELLIIGSQSYSGSVAALKSCGAPPARQKALSEKARHYGTRLLSTMLPLDSTDASFEKALARMQPADAQALFWGTFGWLTWIEQQQGAPLAMADLVVVEQIMARLLELDEAVENGGPHLFFGVLYGTKPEMLGGDPTRSRFHFERALALSDRSFLMVQTLFAETYARMVFDQALHDALLEEVLAFELQNAPAQALSNQIAKRRARELLDENFFGD
ncbi:MAG: TRAP transporter TatT component family protein [Desulfocapsaceae bacterium]